MLRLLLLTTCCAVLSITAYAQNDQMGRVFENGTRIGIAGVSVENLKTKFTTITDNNGRFVIKASVSDILVLKAFSYQPDTVLLTDLKFKELFLTPLSNLLKQVDIHNNNASPVNTTGWKDLEYHGQTVVYQKDSRGFDKGGVSFRIHTANGNEKKREKEQAMEQEDEKRLQIARVFTPANIARYVPLTGDDLNDFALLYIPKSKTYFADDFNMASYLNTCYKEFLKLSPKEKQAGRLVNQQN